jgi:hypothetical protein
MDLYIHSLYVLVSKILSSILNSFTPIHPLYHPLSTPTLLQHRACNGKFDALRSFQILTKPSIRIPHPSSQVCIICRFFGATDWESKHDTCSYWGRSDTPLQDIVFYCAMRHSIAVTYNEAITYPNSSNSYVVPTLTILMPCFSNQANSTCSGVTAGVIPCLWLPCFQLYSNM